MSAEDKPGFASLAAVWLIAGLPVMVCTSALRAESSQAAGPSEPGKSIAVERGKGNCLACHAIADGKLPGNLGPPLVGMKMRYPDKAKLRAQIWDATRANPNSRMPPFGRHMLLTEEEIDLVTDYIYSQ
jgi:sulfur-oxidizing protein SoxX